MAKTMSDLIRRAITSSPMSRYEIAKRCGVSQAALSRFIHGKAMTTDVLDRIAKPLGLKLVVKRGRIRKSR